LCIVLDETCETLQGHLRRGTDIKEAVKPSTYTKKTAMSNANERLELFHTPNIMIFCEPAIVIAHAELISA
jgi:hypothetical protein